MKEFDVVCFDVDSTVISVEGIDELARMRGTEIERQVREMTNNAMGGTAKIPFQDIYRRRLDIIRPTEAEIEILANHCVQYLTEGTEHIVEKLRTDGKDIVLISGGIGQVVARIAEKLKIPEHYAVPLFFDADGNYVGFDISAPTSRDGGKIEVVSRLMKRDPSKKFAFVGDGKTDLETRATGASFIAYTGVVRRPNVVAGADRVIDSMYQLV